MGRGPVDISAQQVVELVRAVESAVPGLGETGVGTDVLVSQAIHATLDVINGIEEGASDGIGAAAAVAIMTQGACAALLDAMPHDNARTHLYRAGRLIGRFIGDRFAEKLRGQLDPDA